MNNQQLFQIVQTAGGMHLLYNNDIEQVRDIAQAAFEAGKQAAGVQDVLDMSDSRNWQVGDVVRCNETGHFRIVTVAAPDLIRLSSVAVEWTNGDASKAFTWIRRIAKETTK